MICSSRAALRIALAESCTGGLITSRLTDVPGSSRYVDRAVVTYANEAKTELLGVDPAALIEAHGAVSEAGGAGDGGGCASRAPAWTSASASPASPVRRRLAGEAGWHRGDRGGDAVSDARRGCFVSTASASR